MGGISDGSIRISSTVGPIFLHKEVIFKLTISCGDVMTCPSTPIAFAYPAKSMTGSSYPTDSLPPNCCPCLTVPRAESFSITKMMDKFCCRAVVSSWPLISKEPSPVMHTTGVSGVAKAVPTAAPMAQPIDKKPIPNLMELILVMLSFGVGWR